MIIVTTTDGFENKFDAGIRVEVQQGHLAIINKLNESIAGFNLNSVQCWERKD